VKAWERKPLAEVLFGEPRGQEPQGLMDLADAIEVLFLTARQQVRDAASYGRTQQAAGGAPGTRAAPGAGVKSSDP
jgi:hypothetical protein